MHTRLGSVVAFSCVAALATAAPAQVTTRVSIDSAGVEGNDESGTALFPSSISGDGRVVAFTSIATNLIATDTEGFEDVFVHDRSTGVTERVSADGSGAGGLGASIMQAVSFDGSAVAFFSYAPNLVAGDTNGFGDVFVRDRAAGTTERISVDTAGSEGNADSTSPAISADGRLVAFISDASNLVAGDTNGVADVFVRDRVAGTTERVSVDSSGVEANGSSAFNVLAISADGRVFAFASSASNLVAGDTNGQLDVFVHDRSSGVTERVSVSSAGAEGDDRSNWPSLSADGGIVAFASFATTLVAGDTNSSWDVFVRDRATGTTERVSVDSSGAAGNNWSLDPAMSGDGRLVAFESWASNLVAADTNVTEDVFVHDRASGVTERVSVKTAGGQVNRSCYYPTLDANGQTIAFVSNAAHLVPNDTNSHTDVFVRERCATLAAWSNYGAGFPGTLGVPAFTSRQFPAFGAAVTLDLANSYGGATFGLLFIGFQRASLHSNLGGDLLVSPKLTTGVTFPSGAPVSFSGTIPNDVALCGLAIDLQAIEADPGAAKGVSFSAGLELVVGE